MDQDVPVEVQLQPLDVLHERPIDGLTGWPAAGTLKSAVKSIFSFGRNAISIPSL